VSLDRKSVMRCHLHQPTAENIPRHGYAIASQYRLSQHACMSQSHIVSLVLSKLCRPKERNRNRQPPRIVPSIEGLLFLHVVANGIWYHARELRMIPFRDQRYLLFVDQRGESTRFLEKPDTAHLSNRMLHTSARERIPHATA